MWGKQGNVGDISQPGAQKRPLDLSDCLSIMKKAPGLQPSEGFTCAREALDDAATSESFLCL